MASKEDDFSLVYASKLSLEVDGNNSLVNLSTLEQSADEAERLGLASDSAQVTVGKEFQTSYAMS